MKNYNWKPIIFWAFTLHILVSAINIVLYSFDIIPHYGLQEYSWAEKGIMSLLFLVSMIVSIFIFKRNNAVNFAINTAVFWMLNFVLCRLDIISFWASLTIRGLETFAFEVNWLKQDIEFFSYGGAFIGNIVAGFILFVVYLKNKKQKAKE